MGEFPNKNTQFSSEYQPERNGRPKKIYTILKEKGFSKDDITTAFGELAMYTPKELEALIEEADRPILVLTVAKVFLAAHADGNFSKIKEIMQYVIGMPVQSINDISENKETIIFQNVSDKYKIDKDGKSIKK